MLLLLKPLHAAMPRQRAYLLPFSMLLLLLLTTWVRGASWPLAAHQPFCRLLLNDSAADVPMCNVADVAVDALC